MYNLIKDLIMIIILISYRQETLGHIKSIVNLLWVSSCFKPHNTSQIIHGPLQPWAGKELNLLSGTGISCCSRNSLLMLVISSAMLSVIDFHK